MPEKLPPAEEYFIDFTTSDQTGYMKAVGVKLFEDVIEFDDTVRVDLGDHPLYAKLVRYVLANASHDKLMPDVYPLALKEALSQLKTVSHILLRTIERSETGMALSRNDRAEGRKRVNQALNTCKKYMP